MVSHYVKVRRSKAQLKETRKFFIPSRKSSTTRKFPGNANFESSIEFNKMEINFKNPSRKNSTWKFPNFWQEPRIPCDWPHNFLLSRPEFITSSNLRITILIDQPQYIGSSLGNSITELLRKTSHHWCSSPSSYLKIHMKTTPNSRHFFLQRSHSINLRSVHQTFSLSTKATMMNENRAKKEKQIFYLLRSSLRPSQRHEKKNNNRAPKPGRCLSSFLDSHGGPALLFYLI